MIAARKGRNFKLTTLINVESKPQWLKVFSATLLNAKTANVTGWDCVKTMAKNVGNELCNVISIGSMYAVETAVGVAIR